MAARGEAIVGPAGESPVKAGELGGDEGDDVGHGESVVAGGAWGVKGGVDGGRGEG